MVYCPDGRAGKFSTELYQRLRGIQNGDLPDKYGWLHIVPAPQE